MLAGALFFHPALAWAEEASDDDGLTIVVKGNGIDEPAFSHSTKTGTPLLDTPQSVTTLSREQLDDQAIARLNDPRSIDHRRLLSRRPA
jgi:outer membrane receptor for ferric coprogen and ferric-rhodotorulic acid